MTLTSRRVALGYFLGFGIVLGVGPAMAQQNTPIAVPDQPLRLSRRLVRSLVDGSQIIVYREWRIVFDRMAEGFAVSGEQLSVRVECPPSLMRLAAIEEARSTDDMWPILLTEDGLIRAAGGGGEAANLAMAIETAKQMIAERSAVGPAEVAEDRYLADLQEAGATMFDQLPEDLFFPRLGLVRAVRSVDLPGGVSGEFEVSYDAVPNPRIGLLATAERKVISRIGNSEQTALEEWRLQEF